MKINKLLLFLILLTLNSQLMFGQANYRPGQTGSSSFLNGEDYITGEDGVVRMSINIWGHVKYPGTYLVYDGIDILTSLSLAGGPMKGAKLSSISIISKDGTTKAVNLKNILNSKNSSDIILKPYDTIYIDETMGNYLLARSNLINILLQITNLILTTSINN